MGFLSIIRPLNCVITFFSVLCGAWIGKEIFFNNKILFAGIAGSLVCAYGNIINDIMDIEIDRINNPKRALASGRIKKNTALSMGILFIIISLIISSFLGFKPLLLVVIAILLLFFYSFYFKKTPVANFVVAIIAGLSFILGGFITDNILSLIPAFFALLIHTPREIIKDISDIEGDRKFGVVSLPIIYGEEKARQIAAILLVILASASPIPYILGFLNIKYLLAVLIAAVPLIIVTIAKLHNARLAGNLLKLIMLVGLGAFIIG
ncbi:MAG: geranylgeranylglycerol-phosphate geranylgeranyltransferase [candidate division WOR-3 bacterium]